MIYKSCVFLVLSSCISSQMLSVKISQKGIPLITMYPKKNSKYAPDIPIYRIQLNHFSKKIVSNPTYYDRKAFRGHNAYILKHVTTRNHPKPPETTRNHPSKTTQKCSKVSKTTNDEKIYIYTRMRFHILLILHKDFFLEKMCQTTFIPFFWNPPKTLAGNCSAVRLGIRTCLISNFLS